MSLSDPHTPPSVLVLGAGFAGLGMGIALEEAGFTDYRILERADRVGGTWRDNTYPGCACDIPSHLYSFSFEPNPDWTRSHPSQAEIQAYIERLASRRGLLRRVRFGTEVRRLAWDEDARLWEVETASGEVLRARVVISAMGPLSRPSLPEIPGLETFGRPAFHTARWDHGVEVRGRHVGVVGTGASAIQVIPALAGTAGRITVFQRTPAWVIPRLERAYSERERAAFRNLPWLRALYRAYLYCWQESLVPGFIWAPALMSSVKAVTRAHMEASIDDPELRARLTPDYQPGCKRILISDDFYQAMGREDVELVTGSIERVEPEVVVTADGNRYSPDVLVLATGFQGSEFLTPLSVQGPGGRSLADDWAERVGTLFGITTTGYPNLFFLVGPNTGLGHNSILFMMECQIGYVTRCLEELTRRGRRTMELRPEPQEEFQRELDRRLRGTIWATGGCRSWYHASDGSIPTLWPGTTVEYWWRTLRPETEHFTFR